MNFHFIRHFLNEKFVFFIPEPFSFINTQRNENSFQVVFIT